MLLPAPLRMLPSAISTSKQIFFRNEVDDNYEDRSNREVEYPRSLFSTGGEKRMRLFIVTLLMVSFAVPALAESRAQQLAKQRAKAHSIARNQQKKMEEAARAQQKQAQEAATVEARKRAADPAYAAAQVRREQQAKQVQAAVGVVVIGALIGAALSGSGDSGGDYESDQQRFETNRRYQKQYWADRAEREAAAGYIDDAKRSLEMAK